MNIPQEIPVEFQKEFSEFLRHKREEVKKELDRLDGMLNKLFNNQASDLVVGPPLRKVEIAVPEVKQVNGVNGTNGTKPGVRGSVGWKFKIDKVLKSASGPVSYSALIERIAADDPEFKKDSFPKSSLGSALATNSVPPKNRYIKKKYHGKTTYSWNPDFQE